MSEIDLGAHCTRGKLSKGLYSCIGIGKASSLRRWKIKDVHNILHLQDCGSALVSVQSSSNIVTLLLR